MEIFTTVWGYITMIGVGLATLVVLIKNLNEIKTQAGSVWNMIFNRRLLREESRRKTAEFQKTVEELKEEVTLLRNADNETEVILMVLLKTKLRERCLEILHRGVEFADEQDEINNLYYLYEKHGWNGSTKSLVERVRRIEVIDRDYYEEWKMRKRRKEEEDEN